MPRKFRKDFIFLALIFCFLAFSNGCVTIYNPATGKNEFIFITTEEEVALGYRLSQQIKKDMNLLYDEQMRARLEKIGQKLADVSDRKDLRYKFNIVDDEEFNAFALPGGFIYVNSGLMKAANDDELACVLGHEIGHVAARHGVKRLQANLGYQLIVNIALGRSSAESILQVLDITYNIIALGYSRQDEFLADKLAVKYAKLAGYNPYGMVTFFKKMEQNKKPGVELVFLSSHPPLKERIKRVEEEISLLAK